MVRNYTEEDDWLPSSVTTSIIQDFDGNIWAATRSGVVCYSGFFKASPIKIMGSQKVNKIYRLDCDSRGRVWGLEVGDSLGVIQLNGNSTKIPKIKVSIPNTIYNIWTSGTTFSVCKYKNETVAAVGVMGHGIYIYRRRQWQFIGRKKNFDPSSITNVLAEGENVYVCSKNGLYYVTDKGIALIDTMPTLALRRSTSHRWQLWFLSPTGFGYRKNNGEKHFYNNSLNVAMIPYYNKYVIMPDYYDKFIYSDKNGIFTVDINTGETEQLNHDCGLIGNVAESICIDYESNLWIATFGGISKINSLEFANYNMDNGLLENATTSIVERGPNDVLLLHKTGFSIFNGTDIVYTKKVEMPKYERVSNAIVDKNKTVWFADYSNGIGKIDRNNNVTWLKPEKFGATEIDCVAMDSNGVIYASDGSRIYTINGNNIKQADIRIPGDTPHSIRHIFIDKHNDLYVATRMNGIVLVHNGHFVRTIMAQNPNNKAARNIYSVFFDNNGPTLVGTEDGLYEINNNRLFKHDFNQQIFQRYIYFIIEGIDGSMWFGTEFGIIRIYPDGMIVNYSVRDGLIGLETYTDAGKVIYGKKLIFGFDLGVSVYRNEYDNVGFALPKLGNLKFYYGNGTRIPNKEEEITLRQKFLDVSFSITSFRNEQHNTVRYMLVGYDKEWHEAYTFYTNTISYRNLPAGKYYLCMYPVNSSGRSGNLFQSGYIIVSNPIYLRPWFIIIAILIAGVTAFLLMRRKISLDAEKIISTKGIEENLRIKILRESNEDYFKNMNGLMLLVSIKTLNIVNVNPAFASFVGLSRENFIGKKITELIKSEMMQTLVPDKFVDYFLRGSRIVILKSPISDAEYSLKVYSSIFHYQSGRDVLVWTMLDISAEVNYEKELTKMNTNLDDTIKQKTHELSNSLASLRHAIILQESTSESLKSAQMELKRLYEHERQENSYKTRFIKTISHEYRTPLTIISSSAEIIGYCMENGKTEHILPAVSKISNSVVTLTEIFDALANSENTKVNKIQFNLNYVINKTMEKVSGMFSADHPIEFIPYSEESAIRQDSTLIAQALFQVLSNAYKHTEPGTKISIKTELFNQILILSVTDYGKGVSPERLREIFNETATTGITVSERPGLGLGLAIAKRSIELAGGTIYADSEYGKWFKMTMEIPFGD